MKWLKSAEKINFGGRYFWFTMSPSPPPLKTSKKCKAGPKGLLAFGWDQKTCFTPFGPYRGGNGPVTTLPLPLRPSLGPLLGYASAFVARLNWFTVYCDIL